MNRRDWKGDIVFSHSMAISRGHVGDNKLHSHWASQLTISLNSELFSPTDMADDTEHRLEKVVEAIQTQLAEGRDIDRDSLAAIVNLSPTRFSHWFVERTGVPLRSYKKWLKLRVTVDAVLEGKNPMQAAMMAGFSDLAHMGRAFSESFGFTYTDAMKAWAQSNLMWLFRSIP